MTKIAAATLALEIEAKARIELAFCRGQIGACHRSTIAHLMPKFETQEEADAYTRGFVSTRNELTAE